MSNFLQIMPWLGQQMAKITANRTSDLKFDQRWIAGEIDIEGKPVARNPSAVTALKARIVATRKSALVASITEDPAVSHLGGLPNLPATLAWPSYNDKPLVLLAQIDLSELPDSGGLAWLPSTGILFYFAGHSDQSEEWSENAFRVLFAAEPSPHEQAAPLGAPLTIKRQNITFEIMDTYAPLSADNDVGHWEDNNEISMWLQNLTPVYRPSVAWQIGGWPRPLQKLEMPYRCERRYRNLPSNDYETPKQPSFAAAMDSWRLLGQFDLHLFTQSSSGYSHGFFWVKANEAEQGDFDRAVLLGEAD